MLKLSDVTADCLPAFDLPRSPRQPFVAPYNSGSTIGTSRVDRPDVTILSGAIPRAADWLRHRSMSELSRDGRGIPLTPERLARTDVPLAWVPNQDRSDKIVTR